MQEQPALNVVYIFGLINTFYNSNHFTLTPSRYRMAKPLLKLDRFLSSKNVHMGRFQFPHVQLAWLNIILGNLVVSAMKLSSIFAVCND